jgi:hypothetical protein
MTHVRNGDCKAEVVAARIQPLVAHGDGLHGGGDLADRDGVHAARQQQSRISNTHTTDMSGRSFSTCGGMFYVAASALVCRLVSWLLPCADGSLLMLQRDHGFGSAASSHSTQVIRTAHEYDWNLLRSHRVC